MEQAPPVDLVLHAAFLARMFNERMKAIKQQMAIVSEWDFFKHPGTMTSAGISLVAKVENSRRSLHNMSISVCEQAPDSAHAHIFAMSQVEREIQVDMARLRMCVRNTHVDLFRHMFPDESAAAAHAMGAPSSQGSIGAAGMDY